MTQQDYKDLIGKAIAEQRKAKGWTLEDLSLLVGKVFSRSSLNAIEHGKQDLSVYEYFLLEKLLGKLPRPEITVNIS